MKLKQVEVGDFVKVLDGSFGEYGVKKGDIIYLAGDALIPADEKDPYALRRVFVAAFLEDGHIQVHVKPFIIDGKRLKPVSEAKQAELEAIKEADFKKEEVDHQTTH